MSSSARCLIVSLSVSALAFGLLMMAGCGKPDTGPGSAPPTTGPSAGMMQGRGQGGQAGMMRGGPGGMGARMMGGGPGGPVAENASGADIFKAKCQFCHGAGGKGGKSPVLAGNSKSEAEMTKIVHDGKEKMPAFGTQLSDAQIKKVIAEVKGFK
jgi:mono/diheme cytochrome c family protein